MRVVADLGALQRGKPVILTIGTFDGVHRGHQWLIRQVVERACTLEFDSMVLSFDPAPQVLFRPGSQQLTNAEEKARIIGAVGPTTLAILPFTRELAEVSASQFLISILDHVNLAEIWVGGDFAFGHNREGSVEFLIRSGQHNSFAVHVVPRQKMGDTLISSTRIRAAVREGDVAAGALLLGHYPMVTGMVVRGAGRGRKLGFPTANLGHSPTQILPQTGIYAGYLRVDERCLPAAVSVGYNVVFGGQHLVVEAYVLDFDEDLYDKIVAVDFVARIRNEQNFESVEALVAQMHRDVAEVRHILDQAEEPGELIF